MGVLDDLVGDRKRLMISVVLVLLLAGFLRLYNIQWSFSNNGIDEGIMLERSLMVGEGYELYSELPCDQAPLAFYIGAVFGGEVVPLRVLVASLSIIAIGACMVVSLKQKDRRAMLLTGVILSVDFVFLRESRLFSLDALSAIFIAFSIPAFSHYIRRNSRAALAAAGLFAGLSTASKLFGALAVIGMLAYMVIEWRRDRSPTSKLVVDSLVMIVPAAVPLLLFMVFLGPGDVVNGMLFEQGGRGLDAFLKLSIVAFFGLNLAYVLPLIRARALWARSKETRYLLCLTVVILAFMIFQPLVFLHHMVLLSPALAVLAGIVIVEELDNNKSDSRVDIAQSKANKRAKLGTAFISLAMVGVVVSSCFASYGLELQGKPMQAVYGGWLKSHTAPDDFVISGDPIISAYAQRMTPPEVVNVAYRQHENLTLDVIESAIESYDVRAVVVCYRLNEINGLTQYLSDSGFTRIIIDAGPKDMAVLDLFQDEIGPVTVFFR